MSAIVPFYQVLLDVTKDEFLAVMEILRCLKSMSTVQGRQQLVEIVTEQAELDQPLEVNFHFFHHFVNFFTHKKI